MSVEQPAVPRTPIFTGPAADARVQQLGIPQTTVLAEALRDGSSGARATTPAHPRAYPGQRMWGEATASLRIGLANSGWMSENFCGVDLTTEPRSGVAVIVTAGDAATGDERYDPQVRYERRDVIQGLVNGHLDTLWSPAERPQWEVWFLLHHLTGQSLRAELSRPLAIGKGGWVSGWAERILIPETGFVGTTPHSRRDNTPPTVEVDVQRRAG